jgi:hypothetical protein
MLAFLDSLFNYGEIFRQVNSVLFMLVSLGLLVRTTTKRRMQTYEHQAAQIRALEEEVHTLRQAAPQNRTTQPTTSRTSVPF